MKLEGFFLYNCYLWLLEQKLKTEIILSFIMPIPTSIFPIFLNSTSDHPAAKAKKPEIIFCFCLPSFPIPILPDNTSIQA